MTPAQQQTLKAPLTFSGVGIHTGIPATVRLRPAAEDTGRVFVTASGGRVPATLEYVSRCDRCTVLGHGDESVSTPEHLLAALAAFSVDNLEIEIDGPEVPILDGSALEYCLALAEVGTEVQQAPAKVLSIPKPFSVGDANSGLVLALPGGSSHFEYVLHYPHPLLKVQAVSIEVGPQSFTKDLAPARTFGLWEEVEPLLARGKAQGGSLENALVIYQDRYSTPLRLEDEPVRHKCLDLIGDFALLGARVQGRVLGVKAGHRLHVECARTIWEEYRSL